MELRADVAVIGGGIVGLSQAWMAARHGKSVVLFERTPQAQGGSIRNFGMVWPIGQTPGACYERALRSRQFWLEAAQGAGIWVEECGSLHVAHDDLGWAVMQEFVPQGKALGFQAEAWDSRQVAARYPSINTTGLRGGLWSSTELCVDPRQAVARLPLWLQEAHGVQLRFNRTVVDVDLPRVRTSTGEVWHVDRAIVCSGVDFETLYPEVYASSGIRRCKLQMMRTIPQPAGWRIGTHLAGSLTLCHYPTFRDCPTLPALRQAVADRLPDFVKYGIHVMASQNHLNEVVIGDTHEYDEDIEIFDKPRLNEAILHYLRGMVQLPLWTLGQTWHGFYAKHPTRPLFLAEPQPGVHIVSAPGGSGMTMSFGWAGDLWQAWEGNGNYEALLKETMA
jgi:FAD dependent oxidoreductase TIGR03364